MINLIPVNLDVDELNNIYPPDSIKSYSKDHLLDILGLISSIPAKNHKSKTPGGYVPLSSQILRRHIGNYKQYLHYLTEVTHVLETNHHYQKGKCKGYRFTPPYRTRVTPVNSLKQQRYKKHKSERRITAAMKKKYGHIVKWFNHHLEIFYEQAMEYIHRDYEKNLKSPVVKKVTRRGVIYKDADKQYRAAHYHIEAIQQKSFHCNIDTNVKRFHSNLTNMNSQSRKFLTYNGKELHCLDISNSQPYLSLLLFSPEFWNGEKGGDRFSVNRLGIKSLLKGINKSKLSSYIMYQNTSVMQAGSELHEFMNLVTSGKFYELMRDKINSELGYHYTRDEVKTLMLMCFFSDNRFIGQPDAEPKRIFKQLFPFVYGFFALIKKNDNSLLARLLQRIESYIIIDVITKRIARERPYMPFYTIHDSIATTEVHIPYLRMVMEQELYKYIGFAPTLKTERWCPSNVHYSDGSAYIELIENAA